MEFKGTQGDWIGTLVEVSEDVSIPYFYINGFDEKRICSQELNSSIDIDEMIANKKLLESAPKMLKSLQLMVSNFKENQHENGAKNQAILKAERIINEALGHEENTSLGDENKKVLGKMFSNFGDS